MPAMLSTKPACHSNESPAQSHHAFPIQPPPHFSPLRQSCPAALVQAPATSCQLPAAGLCTKPLELSSALCVASRHICAALTTANATESATADGGCRGACLCSDGTHRRRPTKSRPSNTCAAHQTCNADCQIEPLLPLETFENFRQKLLSEISWGNFRHVRGAAAPPRPKGPNADSLVREGSGA